MAIGDISTFNYTGAVQTMQLLAGKRYKIECWGAQGGTWNSKQGGNGGYVSGEYSPSADVNINIYVGQQPTTATGGWNGGGNGTARGGGGASDIRIGGTALANRIIVVAVAVQTVIMHPMALKALVVVCKEHKAQTVAEQAVRNPQVVQLTVCLELGQVL